MLFLLLYVRRHPEYMHLEQPLQQLQFTFRTSHYTWITGMISIPGTIGGIGPVAGTNFGASFYSG
jgi:hypothetical protein